MTRLTEIYVQFVGPRAIEDPVIAAELEISEDQQAEIREIRSSMQEEMRALRNSEDRQAMREKVAELNKQIGEKIMAVLSEDQQAKMQELKGEAFEMPEDALRGGGRRGRGGQRSDF
jgi:hypothetical protein